MQFELLDKNRNEQEGLFDIKNWGFFHILVGSFIEDHLERSKFLCAPLYNQKVPYEDESKMDCSFISRRQASYLQPVNK